MIAVRVKFDDGQNVCDGNCQVAAIPPIGGHLSMIDRNGNRCILSVTDVVVGAASDEALKMMPGLSQSELSITIFGKETFGHYFSDPMRP